MGEIKDVQPKGQTGVQDDLELTNQKLARVERALRTSQDVMDDNEGRETYATQARLIKRRRELEQVQAHGEQLARQREQAQGDIESAGQNGGVVIRETAFIHTDGNGQYHLRRDCDQVGYA